ncbi:MAG: uridine diphosphate-N-acetylglucosamine-binding protein YvcK [Blastocatellia bacterium]
MHPASLITSPTSCDFHMTEKQEIKVVAIGGGTGLSTMLGGLKRYLPTGQRSNETAPQQYPSLAARLIEMQIRLTAIVTVTDDGRSSGRLRREFSVLPPGDIRSCLVALAREDRLMTRLFQHRFPGHGEVGGHSLGNLIILALSQMQGDFLSALDQTRMLLGCTARILPSTLETVDLVAEIGEQIAPGQRAIKALRLADQRRISRIAIQPASVSPVPEAIEAILEADLITLGPGSLFTSVIPNLLINGIADAINASRAKRIYICNAMTESDETDGFTAADHVDELLRHGRGVKIDYALFNSAIISGAMQRKYAAEHAIAIDPPPRGRADNQVYYVSVPLVSEDRAVRHDPEKLTQAIFELYHL